MDPVLAYTQRHAEPIIELIRELVECESPSDDAPALARMRDLLAERVAPIAKVKSTRTPHLLAEMLLPGRRRQGQILVLGHFDTVWPVGTLARMPFRREGGRLWGPGVLDMKGGIAFFLWAMRALRELELPVGRKVVLLLTADEETGSATSRQLVEQQAKASSAVLVLEPGTGLEGKLKTARKGVGVYQLHVRGKAAHAGVDPENGASAVVELARQIVRIAGWSDPARGVTLNPGVIAGGTRSNVVAAEARAEIDVRVAKLRQAAALDRKLRGLKPFDPRCALTWTGGVNRPPMERTREIVRLFRLAQGLAAELGVRLEESMTGGGSDGNFTAALGVPTLDGLGAVGEGAHAAHESILIDRIADRTALLAKLVQAL
jgi:glutamate carboxypeptidase